MNPGLTASAPPGPEPGRQGGRLRVLIAEDDAVSRMILSRILLEQEHDVTAVEDGARAVAAFRDGSFELVLLDVTMPVMDGYEAARQIKAAAGERFIPIVFLTAITDEHALARCIDAGGDDFLVKPYSPTILSAKVEALIRTRDLYETVRRQRDELERHRRRRDHEIEIARSVFDRLSRRDSALPGGVRRYLSPSAQFNGDALLVERCPGGVIHLLVADFTGHGLTAALGSIPLAELFHTLSMKGYGLSELVAGLNQKLREVLPLGMFCAACAARIDIERGVVSVWNGGLPDLLQVDEAGKVVRRIPSSHLPLGIVDEREFDGTLEHLRLAPRGALYIYTDGAIEVRDRAGEPFGQERLDALLAGGGRDRFDVVTSSLKAYCEGVEQSDDITLVEFLHEGVERDGAGPERANEGMRAGGPWGFRLELGAEALRRTDPVPLMLDAVAQIQGLGPHRAALFTILTELFSNALDHGLLRLDSGRKSSAEGFIRYYEEREAALAALQEGCVAMECRYQPSGEGGRVTVTVEDSGPGFPTDRVVAGCLNHEGLCGRGIALVSSLARSVTFSPRGNRVEVVYGWG